MTTGKQICSMTTTSVVSVYAANILNVFFGLNYMQASALAGASICPAVIGGFIGCSIYYKLSKFPFLSTVIALPIGLSTYAAIASIIVTPINGVEVFFATYGRPFLSIFSALFGGATGGITLGLLLKKKL